MLKTIDHGDFEDPWRGPVPMTEEPWIHPSALVKNSRMGAWTMVGQRCEVMGSDLLDYSCLVKDVEVFNAEVGKFCNVASHVRINPTNHPMWRATLHHFTYRSRSHFMAEDDDQEIFDWRNDHRVTIGPDVWIGHGAVLMPGVSVGAGAIIGSGSIVTKNVAPYTIVAGNPSRLIRRRVSEKTEETFMLMAWWDWNREKIINCLPDFRNMSAEAFAEKYALQ